ncbi:MAG: M12 family metallopeptidase [Acidobacteriota bacterium]|nr:M12 family metallopeptidase [Acidobacteriota bacterium]MDH3524748.1 M12 family metallopeptidase [Acidobacteriota bacterium]
MAKAPKMCFDRLLPRDLKRMQLQREGAAGRSRAISLIGKQWPNGSTIRVRFLGGSASQKDLVRDVAPQWTQHANLEFAFTEDPTAEIRVSFDANDGAWSYVGIDNLDIPLHAATLNLGWQDEGVILHEFGHMIGLSHEHQNPDGGLQWNEQKVIADLAGPPNFWDPETTRRNVLHKYSADQLHGTEFDRNSIMLYAFPASWTVNGVSTHENEKLSTLDKAFVASEALYPPIDGGGSGAVALAVTEAQAASIGNPGEVDLFSFEAASAGRHVIQTLGATDVFMTLFGPDSQTAKIADDDDSGSGRNALIAADLSPGTYYVQVRHYDERRTGEYQVLVSR